MIVRIGDNRFVEGPRVEYGGQPQASGSALPPEIRSMWQHSKRTRTTIARASRANSIESQRAGPMWATVLQQFGLALQQVQAEGPVHLDVVARRR